MSDYNISIIGREFNTEAYEDMSFHDEVTVGKIPYEKFHSELTQLTNSISKSLGNLNNDLSSYQLDELTVSLEISVTGSIGILGTGTSGTGKGGVELKFKKTTVLSN